MHEISRKGEVIVVVLSRDILLTIHIDVVSKKQHVATYCSVLHSIASSHCSEKLSPDVTQAATNTHRSRAVWPNESKGSLVMPRSMGISRLYENLSGAGCKGAF
jgi:hypothetical protein